MNYAEKLSSYAIACTSLAALIISIIELPSNPSESNVLLAILVSIAIVGLASYYLARRHPRSKLEEEKRLRDSFPRIFAFVDSIDSIKGENDFQKLEAQLNQLIELEKRGRSIRWKEMQEIETIRGIALAKLVKKKRFS